jgi:hypothetical protein
VDFLSFRQYFKHSKQVFYEDGGLFFSRCEEVELEEKNQNEILLSAGVARWYIFKPIIPIWVNFGRP